ncbi:hypothetical protein CDD80_1867 [Ophiocordyceps camponoti-rufipedis]|uniref:Zn(2)-C6 fungal-type domain-containing protein n=1 Tax=Ophiocordyceps camponoti-rufipedis TaxID=2004952 RepID=A0A2C5YDA5_9HYPO|nr:hypothetical protein CDD80_1867 [Ophiocordyceps camponoti-rufipedis]
MPQMREVKTCDRCRHFKRRCDLLKPSCTRCVQAGIRCSFESSSSSLLPSVVTHHEVGGSDSAFSVGASFAPAVVVSGSPPSPGREQQQLDLSGCGGHGLMSPTTSTESPEPGISLLGPTLSASHVETLAAGEECREQDQQQNIQQQHGMEQTMEQQHQQPGMPRQQQQRIVRKRKRNCLSCLRCHRLKVKCDKELPCGRCKASGNGRECYYSYNKGPNGGKFPCPTAPVPSSRDEKKPQMATWQVQHRVRGSSHWRELMTKIGTLAAPAAGQSTQLAAALEGVGTNACLANFCLPGNFPFGTPGATKYYSRDAVTRLLAGERARAGEYLSRYLELLDVVNPVLDMAVFADEMERYWADPNGVSLCWLAQFLMVMGLGCFTSADEPPVATELMMAAEACLMQTPFMFRPTLMTLRAIALMSVAKLVCNATCWSVDSCWTLLGLLVRVAFIFGLPQEKGDNDEELRDPVEREARRRLWLTILYLDVKVSMCTGMPPLTRPDELGACRMGSASSSSASSNTVPPPSSVSGPGASATASSSVSSSNLTNPAEGLHAVLCHSLPTVLAVLAQINVASKEPMAYADVLRFNKQLRDLMNLAQRACPPRLQRITVDVFLRRCLMVLHRPFALHPDGPTLFPESYWSSLECSLALLVHYRELWCGEAGLRLDLVGRAFVLDFFSATLTTCVHMLREDAPLSGAAATGCCIPPRQLILDTLAICVDIWSGEQEKSVCWRTGYHLLRAVLALLPGMQGPGQGLLGPDPGPQMSGTMLGQCQSRYHRPGPVQGQRGELLL